MCNIVFRLPLLRPLSLCSSYRPAPDPWRPPRGQEKSERISIPSPPPRVNLLFGETLAPIDTSPNHSYSVAEGCVKEEVKVDRRTTIDTSSYHSFSVAEVLVKEELEVDGPTTARRTPRAADSNITQSLAVERCPLRPTSDIAGQSLAVKRRPLLPTSDIEGQSLTVEWCPLLPTSNTAGPPFVASKHWRSSPVTNTDDGAVSAAAPDPDHQQDAIGHEITSVASPHEPSRTTALRAASFFMSDSGPARFGNTPSHLEVRAIFSNTWSASRPRDSMPPEKSSLPPPSTRTVSWHHANSFMAQPFGIIQPNGQLSTLRVSRTYTFVPRGVTTPISLWLTPCM